MFGTIKLSLYKYFREQLSYKKKHFNLNKLKTNCYRYPHIGDKAGDADCKR